MTFGDHKVGQTYHVIAFPMTVDGEEVLCRLPFDALDPATSVSDPDLADKLFRQHQGPIRQVAIRLFRQGRARDGRLDILSVDTRGELT